MYPQSCLSVLGLGTGNPISEMIILLGQCQPTISVSSLNINGWMESNCKLRKQIIKNINNDIFCVVETHSGGVSVVGVEN